MYSLMVVDDDQLVRRRILSAISFEELGIELCGEAENGIRALELFGQCHPQIVVMDIHIPFINGIEVAKKILAEDEDVHIIIVTGHGTVDFAKEAIRNGMVDFLLKPIDFQELRQTLQRIALRIAEHTKQVLEQRRMQRLLELGMPLIRDRYFLSLMSAQADQLQESDCRAYLRDFGIADDEAGAVCVAIVCPNYNTFSVDRKLPLQSILADEITRGFRMSGAGSVVMFDALGRALVIAYGQAAQLAVGLEQRLVVIRDRMRNLYHLDFHASIGSPVPEFRRLQRSYQDAERALGCWHLLGNNNIVSSENILLTEANGNGTPTMSYAELAKLIMNGDAAQLQTAFGEYFNRLARIFPDHLPVLRRKGIELAAMTAACIEELGGRCERVTGKAPYALILYTDNAGEILKAVCEFAVQMLDEISRQREQKSSRALAGAKQCIRQFYHDPGLSLSTVAEHVRLTPGYLSQLFSREGSQGFTDYLNWVRVQEAIALLRSTHLHVYEVAKAVGYQNAKYFFQVFKQTTGKRPREFQDGNMPQTRG